MLVGQAWLPEGAEVERDAEHDTPGGRPSPPTGPTRPTRAAPHGHAARAVITFTRLKYLSFTHSAIYLALLVTWLSDGPDELRTVLGWAHGIGWIVMSLLCIVGRPAARDPALAGRDGGGRRRGRAVRREHLVRGLRKALHPARRVA